jgi:glycosyltransferase involved in cell wall biosynthesis
VAGRINARDDIDVTVLATDRTRARPRSEVRGGVQVLRVPAWPAEKDYYLAPGVARVVADRSRWDLVHCQGVHTPVPIVAMTAARRARLPYLMTFHTGGHSLAHRNAMRALQWRAIGPLLRRADALVGVSAFEAELLRREAATPGVSPVPGRVLSTGRLERYKGHHRALEALPHLLEHDPAAHVVVLGAGPYQGELQALAERLGVADKVDIRSVAPTDRVGMADELAAASVVAALSDYEAHPVAVMEALVAGRPVVGVDIAGIGDLVAEGWVHPVAPTATAAQVAAALREVALAPGVEASTHVDISTLPTWDTCADQLAEVYLDVATRTGARSTSAGGTAAGGASASRTATP